MIPAAQLRTSIVLAMAMIVLAGLISAQGANDAIEATTDNTINIFVDGPFGGSDYFRENITMANFVRDRKQADIHILITLQHTGSGGNEYTIEFIGQGQFNEMRDTLVYYSGESDTEDMIREGLVKKINAGLVRYLARTPQLEYLSVSYSSPIKKEEVKDKWNYWVFSIGSDVWMNGERSRRNLSLHGNISAKRVTEEIRMQFSFSGSYNQNWYEYSENDSQDHLITKDTTTSTNSKNSYGLVYFNLGEHWSAGFYVEAYTSSYSNIKFCTEIFPAIEYNLFPYSESTRRQLRFAYLLGFKYYDYEKLTILGKYNEWIGRDHLDISLEMIEPWGKAEIGASLAHYLYDLSMYNFSLDGELSVRLYEGLSFNIYGDYSKIQDQISLAISEDDVQITDVLFGNIELPTSYRYYMSFGLSYSFGSIYNNVVNPRFGY
ncbi:MAG: hypothetical protein ABIE07_10130 [Candidatus Zixiibacteriota bacterium]